MDTSIGFILKLLPVPFVTLVSDINAGNTQCSCLLFLIGGRLVGKLHVHRYKTARSVLTLVEESSEEKDVHVAERVGA